MTRSHAAAVLPSRNEAATIQAVTKAVDAALNDPGAVIIHADSSDTPDTAAAFSAVPTRAVKISLTCLPRGKGHQVLRGLDWLGRATGPVLIADTDTRNPDPAVYRALLDHAEDSAALAIADYPRFWEEANLTNHLARPLIAAACGLDVPQPLAGDLAISAGTVTTLPAAYRSLPGPEAAAVRGYGIDAFLLLAAARCGPVASVPVDEPKKHAASFPHLAAIFHQAAPVLLALTATWPASPPEPNAYPRYRAAERTVEPEHLQRMLVTLNGLIRPAPVCDTRPWPLPVADAWQAVKAGTPPTAAARALWPHYVHRVRDWLTAQPGADELSSAHRRLHAALTDTARSST